MTPKPRILNETPEMVPQTLIRCHPRNARQGDIGAVYTSITENGWWGYIIAQKSTGYILVGNHRFQAGCAAQMTEFPVVWVDVSDEEALRILLADNRTSDLGSYDNGKLAEMLSELHLQTEKGLTGTAYDADFLDDLIGDLARAAAPPPEPEEEKRKGEDRLAIVLICENEDEQETLNDKLKAMGFYPRKTILNERTQLAVG